MTLDDFLAAFTAGASQLPGWTVTHGRLRYLDGCCPLVAQWNLDYPERPLRSNQALATQESWSYFLDLKIVSAIMDAADYVHRGDADGALATLRSRLLAACHLAEEGRHAPD